MAGRYHTGHNYCQLVLSDRCLLLLWVHSATGSGENYHERLRGVGFMTLQGIVGEWDLWRAVIRTVKLSRAGCSS